MRYLELFEADPIHNDEYERITSICQSLEIEHFSIGIFDGVVDADDVYINDKDLTEIPVQFGRVSGKFWCHNNRLTSLRGAPYWVQESMRCDHNRLTSLEFIPTYIGNTFLCHNNSQLTPFAMRFALKSKIGEIVGLNKNPNIRRVFQSSLDMVPRESDIIISHFLSMTEQDKAKSYLATLKKLKELG
jgi:hypothetical protein